MQHMNDIRHHIRAVEQTRKITGAMYLISSARIKKIQSQVEYNRKYMQQIQNSMAHILDSTESLDHSYLHDRGDKHKTFIVVAGDKGMVGAFNNDVLKFALPYVQKADNRYLITVGLVASKFFQRMGIRPDSQIIGASQDPSLFYARHLTQDIFKIYDARRTSQVYLIFQRFVSTVHCEPTIIKLLPIDTDKINGENRDPGMIYHPSPEEVFQLLVPQYTLGILYGALMQSYVSEHCARMNAMQSATTNADEIKAKLKTAYNIARQSAITQEIIEITSAAMAQSDPKE